MKKTISLIIVCTMLLAILPMTASAEFCGFQDVSADDYFSTAVQWAVAWGVTNGTSETTFSPEDICTRAQVVTFLWRAHGEPEPKANYNPFADVPRGSWYDRASLWAVEQGITTGTSTDPILFSPNEQCTYKEILTFIWRAKGSQTPAFPSQLTNDWPDSYYKDAVTWADNNAMLEDEGESIDPDRPCDRGRTVAWLWREAQVYASDAAGLMAAIGPGREIHLAPGVYNLTEWVKQRTVSGMPNAGNPYIKLDSLGGGEYEIQIRGVRNMTITADGFLSTGTVELVVEPRYANVLVFDDCDQIVLSGLTMGHTPEQGFCTGGVLCFKDCGRIALSGMDLYGCGTYGIVAERVDSIQTVDSVIRDCSYGLLDLAMVKDAGFGDVIFRDCTGYDMICLRESNATFQSCVFRNNTWDETICRFLAVQDSLSSAAFRDCIFDQKAYYDLTSGGNYTLLETPNVD